MTEKRCINRTSPIYRLAIQALGSSAFVGFLLDIHPGGMMLIGEHPVSINTELELRLPLPTEILGRKEIHFSASCLWAKKAPDGTSYHMGFRFTDISILDLKIIELLIKSYCSTSTQENKLDGDADQLLSNGDS